MEEEMIYCPRCKQEKPASEFGSNKAAKNGRQTYCRECMAAAVKQSFKNKHNGTMKKSGRSSLFTEKTLNEINEYREAGFTYKEIAEFVGIKPSTIFMYFYRHPEDKVQPKPTEEKANETKTDDTMTRQTEPVLSLEKPKTLQDFSPREMIKYLYKMGYRIENNTLVVLQKVPVKLNDIING